MSDIQGIIDQLNVLRVEDPTALLSVKVNLEFIIQAAEFPTLMVRVTGEGDAAEHELLCPTCGEAVKPEDIYAVDAAERWTSANYIEVEDETAMFYFDDPADWGDTLYYIHDQHPVAFPEGWSL